MKKNTVEEILYTEYVSGVLVGGASLTADLLDNGWSCPVGCPSGRGSRPPMRVTTERTGLETLHHRQQCVGFHRRLKFGQGTKGQSHHMPFAIQPDRDLALPRVRHQSAVKVKAPADASASS